MVPSGQRCGRSERFGKTLRTFAGSSLVIGSALFVVAYGSVAAQAQSPEELVALEYGHRHELLEDQDREPLMRIFASGLVRVHYPAYMKRAGDYEIRLTQNEFAELLDGLAEKLSTIDVEGAKAERRALRERRRAGGQLHHVSDTTVTIIRYRPSLTADAPLRTIEWDNVATDLRFYSEIAAVQVLGEVEATLRSLLDSDRMVRVDASEGQAAR